MEKTEPCPSCRTQTPLKKSWKLKRGKGSKKKTFRIFLFECPKCGRNFRKAKPEEDPIYYERDVEQLRSPLTDKEGKRSKILVEWICGKCKQVHRISFAYSFRPLWHKKGKEIRAKWKGKCIKAKWGDSLKSKLLMVKLGHETSLSELNEFLNSLFYEKFNAKEYVKIYYPKKLLVFLRQNEGKTKALPSKLIHSYTLTINDRMKIFYSYRLKET